MMPSTPEAAEELRSGGGHGLVVGVTARGENTAALCWAAREGRARGAQVTLVHVVEPVFPPPSGGLLVDFPDLMEVGNLVASGAVEEYDDIAGKRGGDPCRSLVVQGHSASILAALSEQAEMVVLAHRHLSGIRRVFTGSVTVALAAHAACPVVSVPRGWGSSVTRTDEPTLVTIGVHETGTPEPLLQAGFEAAVTHGCGVRLLHAWRLDPEYDERIFRRVGDDWVKRVRESIAVAVEPLAEKYPDVPVTVDVLHDWPADALVRASRESDLLVVGRHGQRPMMPRMIGSIARTLLSHAVCPVMVVPS